MRPISIKEILQATEGTLLHGDDSLVVLSVEQDSRNVTEGSLFVPFVGEKVDAHKFIPQVFEAGAVATFTMRPPQEYMEGKAYILVEDTLDALQKLAGWYRDQFQIPIIGVTGSVGKTTTKEMIAAVLQQKYRVLKTKGNLNSQIGVSLMMFCLDEDVDIAVIEMGISQFGEMDKLVSIVKPTAAVLTNVGVSHIGNLLSRDNICLEKGKIVSNLPEDGALFVCGNGDLKELSARNIKHSKIYYGTENQCEYMATDIENHEGTTSFCLNGGERVNLSVMGVHNVNNALVAIALGERFGVSLEQAKEGLYAYKPIKMRGVIQKGNGMEIIDDTYNASPDSIRSGIDVLLDYPCKGRRIALLADVLELGERSKVLHKEIGIFINERKKEGKALDLVLTVGTEAACIAKALTDTENVMFDKREDAVKYLLENKKDNDLILVKGSRGMEMDLAVKALLM